MNLEFTAAIDKFISLSWRFFTDIDVPGLGISFAALFVGIFFVFFGLRILASAFHLESPGGSYGGSSGGRVKISKERQHDTR